MYYGIQTVNLIWPNFIDLKPFDFGCYIVGYAYFQFIIYLFFILMMVIAIGSSRFRRKNVLWYSDSKDYLAKFYRLKTFRFWLAYNAFQWPTNLVSQ